MLIADLKAEWDEEFLGSPALQKLWDTPGSVDDLIARLPERYRPLHAMAIHYGSISQLRPDSGQIDGEPTGWNFGTEAEPRWKYRFEDWPSEYREYWKQRPKTPQADFLNSSSKITAIIGGNGVSKTTSVAAMLVACCHGVRPWLTPDDPNFVMRYPDGREMTPPVRVLYMTDDFSKIMTVLYMEKLFRIGGWSPFMAHPRPRDPCLDAVVVNQALCKGGSWEKATKKNSTGFPIQLDWANGSSVHYSSYQQDPKAWEGPQQEVNFYDEPPVRPAWVASQRGLRTSGGPTYLALTPISEPWIQTSIIDASHTNKAIKVVVTDSFSNYKNQDPAWLYERWDDLHPLEIRARIFGRYSTTAGAIFKEFSPRLEHRFVIRSREIPAVWPVVFGFDPHPHKRSVCSWLLVRPDDGVEVIHTKILNGIGAESQIQEIQQLEVSFPWKNRVVIRVPDPHNWAQTASFVNNPEAMTNGDYIESKSPSGWIWEMPEIRGPGSLDVGHNIIHDRFRLKLNRITLEEEPRLQIWEDGDEADLITAFTRYSSLTKRIEGKDEEVETGKVKDDEYKDRIDTVRYPLVYGLSFEALMAVTAMAGRSRPGERPVPVSKTGW